MMSLNSVRLLYIESLYSSQKYQNKPDGHFGWIVVLASSIISMLDDGYAYTSGQFYTQFLSIYGKSETITSIYISIMNGTIYMISPLASGLIKVYGCRWVSILGFLLAITGMISSTIFDQSIYYHFITIGFLTGSGLGLLFITQVLIVVIWFDRKLALATGLAECGSGFGMAVFALASDYFINVYGWKGAMIILAGLLSTGLVFSSLYAEPQCPLNRTIFSSSNFTAALKETIDFSLLKANKQYLLFVISQFVLNLVFFTPITIISDRIKRTRLAQSGASIYVYFGIANGFGRILFGWISSCFEVNNLWLLIAVTIGLGTSIMITNLATTMAAMKLFYSFIGIFFGANVCLTPVILVDMLGHNKMANAYGIVSFFNGLAALIGLPLLNLTVPANNNSGDIYATAILIAGFVSIFSILFLIPFYCNRGTSSSIVVVKIEDYFSNNKQEK